MTIEFYDLKVKDDKYLHALSESFTLEYGEGTLKECNCLTINGKVASADKVTITISNVAFDWMCLVYNFSSYYIHELITTTKDRYLRYEEVSFILKNFNVKQNVDKEKYPLEYALSKVYINAMYGVKVQKQMRDRIAIEQGEIVTTSLESLTDEQVEDMYYNDKELQQQELNGRNGMFNKNFDIFTDGLYITDYARLHLLECMVALVKEGATIIYADTDSLKFHHPDSNKFVTSFVKRINKAIEKGNMKHPRFNKFSNEYNLTDEQFQRVCELGQWDIETYHKKLGKLVPYTTFKTLGAKKYAYVWNEKMNITVSGLNKEKALEGMNAYKKMHKKSSDETVQDIFTVGTRFDESCSGRTIARMETRDRNLCEMFTYKGEHLHSYGGIVIEDTTYTLNVGKRDSDTLGIEREKDYHQTLTIKGELVHE